MSEIQVETSGRVVTAARSVIEKRAPGFKGR